MKSIALVAAIAFYEEDATILCNAYIQSDIGQPWKVLFETTSYNKAKCFDSHTDMGRYSSREGFFQRKGRA